ncbi:SDR family oxidoreductase [Luminiphilus sp.]|nr:UDP-glucuronic acid decarboxylase family protein [Luminiphilus sp.]MDA9625214.1 SDR family oxidoreductase [Luminiphilus sp.]
MTALVFGGAGFVGSHLCERLLSEGHKVLCADDLSTGALANINRLRSARFDYVHWDICKPIDVDVSLIFNLACPASPKDYQRTPTRTTKTAVMGAINCLELANKTGATVFQASTSEVYGDAKEHPQAESYWGNVNPIGIRACYDEGKRCAETLFFDYHREFGTDIRVGRIFNTYGPRMKASDGRVVSTLITQALRGEPLTIFGDGSQTRSFCYVDDLIEAIIRIVAPGVSVGPINLGNPNEVTVLQLANMILSLTASKSQLQFQELPQDDPMARSPAIHLATSSLGGWVPAISLEEGLKKTIAYLQRELRL